MEKVCQCGDVACIQTAKLLGEHMATVAFLKNRIRDLELDVQVWKNAAQETEKEKV